ncbi:Lcl C-terminal domain-containing protein [Methylovulum psychrotolerans]|uniref:Lcl C-terminal domain-containing protein n=1 Tax=Methylovulum psychrotolerans TaxID=1704499 RepID=A0A1Z4C3S7_9GAMM|nr:DUF1566 domain-containing protein [Methylovulum psychrotolerans]ASF48197.1 hypothetical protein CEK71_20215 [Methylovulum psychrotolerans]
MKSWLKLSALSLTLALMSLNTSHAAPPVGKQVTGAVILQGGSDSAVKWPAPLTDSYKVHVFTPNNGTATNALYRVYPNGKRAGSTACLSTDAKFPCYEVTVDQTQHQNAWTQLMQNDDPATKWNFVKGKGYVTLVASNLSAAELLSASVLVRFENQSIVIGKIYQGGIIFYVDNSGEHGLVAAATDQSTGIQWSNGTYLYTGANGVAVGTGAADTNSIIKSQGAGSYAATLAANLVLGGYSDWFLPSKDELNLMYQNIGAGAAAPLTNIGGFTSNYYWSSSEYGYRYAWVQEFGAGSPGGSMKSYTTLYVRAVRAF